MLCAWQPGSAEVEPTRCWVSSLCPWEVEKEAGFAMELKLLWKAVGFGSAWPALCSTLHPRNVSSGVGSAGIAGIVRDGVGWWIWLRQDAAAARCAVSESPALCLAGITVSLKERFWSHVGSSPRSAALPSLVPWEIGRELQAAAGSCLGGR